MISDKKYDVAILGAGPCGLFAAFQAKMLNMSCVIVDRLPEVGGQCSMLYPEKMIYDIPASPSISAQALIDNLMKQIENFDVDFIMNSKVNEIEYIDDAAGDDYKYFSLQDVNKDKVAQHDGVVTEIVKAKSVIIAAGGGIFSYNKPPLSNLSEFEGKTVHYSVQNKKLFSNKRVLITGGGDSAVDWAVTLADIAKKVYVVHRRSKFRAMPASVDRMRQLEKEGKIEIISPYQVNQIYGEGGQVSSISLKSIEDSTIERRVAVDECLFFFGLTMHNTISWGIQNDGKHLTVDPKTMSTNRHGIFAVGDICDYPGKLKLILTGFAEAARACHSAYEIVNPDTPLHFEYSTTKMGNL